MTATRLTWSAFAAVGTLAASLPAEAHEAHMLIGRTAGGRLTWSAGDGVQHQAWTILKRIPPGGPIQGFSASVPGFGLVASALPPHDCFPLETGADVWLEIVAIDAPLLMIETPSYRIINEQSPPRMRIGGDPTAHVHPLWLLDSTDPGFDPHRCVWEIAFILTDAGSTQYASSEVLTFRFAAERIPSPADFDCDGDVDQDDVLLFQECITGPAVPNGSAATAGDCPLPTDHAGFLRADLDRDGDVDQSDFGSLQRCYSGSDVPAIGAC